MKYQSIDIRRIETGYMVTIRDGSYGELYKDYAFNNWGDTLKFVSSSEPKPVTEVSKLTEVKNNADI